jgi:pSer/pThr/pTyr-binding forkhead associated (FHA) protein
MKRSLTIMEGPAKGRTEPLDKTLMIIGRSRHADFQLAEDPFISKRHLEVRAEPEGVFVENLSPRGTALNGKPLAGAVSLNPGDVLTVGHTVLRYEESGSQEQAAEVDGSATTNAPDSGGTLTSPAPEANHEWDSQDDPDRTRALAAEETRMADPSELFKFISPTRKRTQLRKPLLVGGFFVILLAALGATFWWVNHSGFAGDVGEYTDPASLFSLTCPEGWSKLSAKADLVSFGIGSDRGAEWARINVHFDRHPEHALTSFTDGFAEYESSLKQQFNGFELIGSAPRLVSDAKVMLFGFSTPKLQGKGIFVLNGDAQIVVECFSPLSCFPQYASAFTAALQSFRLDPVKARPQQLIDYPPPDQQMRTLALSRPAELARQVQEHLRVADTLVREREVRPENLFGAIKEYQTALQLSVAGPQRLPAYASAAQRMGEAVRLYKEALARQRFEMTRAIKENDGRAACLAAIQLMQMVPDKTDAAYLEASHVMTTYKSALREQP